MRSSTCYPCPLLQDLLDRILSILVPQALGIPLEPLALLETRPAARNLSERLPASEKPVSLLPVPAQAHFMAAWRDAAAASIVPSGPFDPALFQCYSSVVLSGGECRETNVVLRTCDACEVIWRGDSDPWQRQPALDSVDDSDGSDLIGDNSEVRSSRAGKGASAEWGRGRSSSAKGRRAVLLAAAASATAEGTNDDAEEGSVSAAPLRTGLARVLRSSSAAAASSSCVRVAAGTKRRDRSPRCDSGSGSSSGSGGDNQEWVSSSSESCRTVQACAQGGDASSGDPSSSEISEPNTAGTVRAAPVAPRNRSVLKVEYAGA